MAGSRYKHSSLLIGLYLIGSLNLVAPRALAEQFSGSRSAGFDLGRAGAYLTSYLQPGGSDSNSALLLWSPTYSLDDKLSLIADLGGTYLNTPEHKFFVISLSAGLSYHFSSSLSAEINGGVQNWTSEAADSFEAGGGLTYHLKPSFIPYLDALRGGFAFVAKTDFPTWQLFLGLQFDFGRPASSPVLSPTPKPEKTAVPTPGPVSDLFPEEATHDKITTAVPEGFKVLASAAALPVHFDSDRCVVSPSVHQFLGPNGQMFAEHDSKM